MPFFGPGTPVEYELVRSIATVADANRESARPGQTTRRKKVIPSKRLRPQDRRHPADRRPTDRRPELPDLSTDAGQEIVAELRKQYQVEDVDSNGAIDPATIDVLIVPQPSSLSDAQLDNVLAAIEAGIPTAVFEDPAPVQFRQGGGSFVPGTDEPKRSPGGMFGMNRQPQPKCDISRLWSLLGVQLVKARRSVLETGADATQYDPITRAVKRRVRWEPFTAVAWQHYNPYPKDPNIPDWPIFRQPRRRRRRRPGEPRVQYRAGRGEGPPGGAVHGSRRDRRGEE